MLKKIGKIIKRNDFSYKCGVALIQYFEYIKCSVAFKIIKFIRFLHIRVSEYEKLKNFKDIHAGESCYIICTGPSLTIRDIELLKNKYTFSMNSILKLFDQTKWRPTYYAIEDPRVYSAMEQYLKSSDLEYVFCSNMLSKQFKIPNKLLKFPQNMLNHMIANHKINTKFSNDIYKEVYDGYSITYSILQIAMYMGFKTIYLLGCDNNYSSKEQHFVSYGVNVEDNMKELVPKRINVSFLKAKEYADKNGVEIYNVTRGGNLEIFPRLQLEDTLIKKENYD